MTDKALRYIAAEARGWKRCDCIDCRTNGDPMWIPPDIYERGSPNWCLSFSEPPDFTEVSSNARNEAGNSPSGDNAGAV